MKTLKDLAAQYTWQPIETAPTDGSEVDLGATLAWPEESCDFDDMRVGRGFYACGAYWYDKSSNVWRNRIGQFLKNPTHWMPLPPQDNPIPQIIEVMEQMARALELVQDIGVHEPVLASAREVMHIKAVENTINESIYAYEKLCGEVE